MSTTASLRWLCVGLLGFGLGCSEGSDGPPRSIIKGTVTYNGEPVKEGEIAFYPDQGSDGIPTSTVITDGQYQVPERFGIAPGTYRVEIKSFRPRDKTDVPDVELPPSALEVRDQLLPEKFNTQSEIEKLTVDGDEPMIVKDFALAE